MIAEFIKLVYTWEIERITWEGLKANPGERIACMKENDYEAIDRAVRDMASNIPLKELLRYFNLKNWDFINPKVAFNLIHLLRFQYSGPYLEGEKIWLPVSTRIPAGCIRIERNMNEALLPLEPLAVKGGFSDGRNLFAVSV